MATAEDSREARSSVASQTYLRARSSNSKRPWSIVFEFENVPDSFRRLVARLDGNNVRIEGERMAVQNVGGNAHSERLGRDLIKAGREANMQLNAREI